MIPSLVWTLPRPANSRYKGAFPLYFEDNLIQLLGYPERILQPFGGMAEHGVRVDIKPDIQPDVVGDAHALPFEDENFDLVILDPPYSDEEATELYETPPLRPAVYVAEAVRVLKEGGWLAIYTDREPARPPRCNHTLRIMVVLRPHHRPRVCMVFQKRKPGMPFYGTEAGESRLLADTTGDDERFPVGARIDVLNGGLDTIEVDRLANCGKFDGAVDGGGTVEEHVEVAHAGELTRHPGTA